jgi:hypothetical protein
MEKVHELAENLRAKPVGFRKMVQVLVTLVLTVIIVIIALFISFLGADTFDGTNTDTKNASPFSIIQESFSGVFTAAEEGFSEIQQGVKN